MCVLRLSCAGDKYEDLVKVPEEVNMNALREREREVQFTCNEPLVRLEQAADATTTKKKNWRPNLPHWK